MVVHQTIEVGVCLACVISTTALGLFCNWKQSRSVSYDKSNVSPILVALSLAVSLLSGISILGPPHFIYVHVNWLLIGLCYPIFTAFTAQIILPKIYSKSSMFDIINQRYGPILTIPVTVQYMLASIYYSGGVLFAPCLAFQAILPQIPLQISIFTVGAFVSAFTTYGGLRGVIYIDAIQALVMLLIQLSIAGIIACKVDNFELKSVASFTYDWLKVNDTLADAGNFRFGTKNNIFTNLVGGAIMCVSIFSLTEGNIQRYSRMASVGDAQKSVWWSMLALEACLLVTCGYGILATYFYEVNQLDVKDPRNIALDVIAAIEAPPGIQGLAIAVVLLAAISTLSTTILAVQNILHKSSKSFHNYQRASSLGIGILITFAGIAMTATDENILEIALKVLSYAGAPVSAVILLVLFEKKAWMEINTIPVLVAFVATTIVSTLLMLSSLSIVRLPFEIKIEFLWMVAFVYALFFGLLVILQLISKIPRLRKQLVRYDKITQVHSQGMTISQNSL